MQACYKLVAQMPLMPFFLANYGDLCVFHFHFAGLCVVGIQAEQLNNLTLVIDRLTNPNFIFRIIFFFYLT
jgi:hypothetical protein